MTSASRLANAGRLASEHTMRGRNTILLLFLGVQGACLRSGYDPITSTQLARHSMRVAHHDDVDVYFPADAEAGAEAASQRMRSCLRMLRAKRKDQRVAEAVTLVLHDGDLNNAYVAPPLGGMAFHMVLPMHLTLEMFNWMNKGVGRVQDVACHEAVHYVMNQEVHGFWKGYNAIFGDFFPPVTFVPKWIHEGTATYYESNLGAATGRMSSPYWRGLFAAGVADRGALHAGMLNGLDRESLGAGSGPYLVGSHFVEYLVNTYGEQKLWDVIDAQARSIFSPFAVTLRFKAVYGKSIGALFDDFVYALDTIAPVRTRPPQQAIVKPSVGYLARLATCPTQARMVVVDKGVDSVTRVSLLDANGYAVWSKRLVDVVPGRDHMEVSPAYVSGLTFTGDCRDIYLTLADVGKDPGFESHVWRLDTRSGTTVEAWGPFKAMGGGVSPDGERYAMTVMEQSNARLAELVLSTGRVTEFATPPEATSVGGAVYSPNGSRIAFAARTEAGFNIFVRDQDGGVRALTQDGAYNYQPRWLDNDTVLFLRGVEQRLQAASVCLGDGRVQVLTDAPYTVMDAAPWTPNNVAFLSAEGWQWNVEVAPLPAMPTPDVAVATTTVSDGQNAEPAVPLNLAAAQRYRSAANFHAPTLRIPLVAFQVDSTHGARLDMAEFWLVGRDVLGYHNYAIDFGYSFLDDVPLGDIAYLNTQLAPWDIIVHAWLIPSRWSWATPEGTERLLLLDRALRITAGRQFWTSYVQVGVVADDIGLTETLWLRPRVGPTASVTYEAGEGTSYGGDAWLLNATVAGTALVGNEPPFAELTASGRLQTPLPFSNRHRLSFQGTARQMFGGTDTWLALRGHQGPASFYAQPKPRWMQGGPFQHNVRGYTDVHWAGPRQGGMEVVYTYPFIIDHGWASLLYVFDEAFIRQVDVDLFASAGAHGGGGLPGSWYRAVGAAINARAAVSMGMPLPLNVGYQVAYRFDDNRGWDMKVVIGPG